MSVAQTVTTHGYVHLNCYDNRTVTDCAHDGFFMTVLTDHGNALRAGETPPPSSIDPMTARNEDHEIKMSDVICRFPRWVWRRKPGEDEDQEIDLVKGEWVLNKEEAGTSGSPATKPQPHEETLTFLSTERSFLLEKARFPVGLPSMDSVEKLRATVNRSGYVGNDDVPSRPIDQERFLRNHRTPELDDFVGSMCLGQPRETYTRDEYEARKDDEDMKKNEYPNRNGNPALPRKVDVDKFCRGDPLPGPKKAGGYLPPHPKAETIRTTWAELPDWTTWCVLDTKGRFPRGSIFVRDLTLVEQYRLWPKVPLFRPPYASEEAWERYMGLVRHCQASNSAKTDESIDFKKLHELISGPSAKFADLRSIHPLDAQGQLEATFLPDRPHLEPLRRGSGRGGQCDYLYVTLVCASGDRERTDAEVLEHGTTSLHLRGKGNDSGFGKVLLQAAKKFANDLGLARVVLSALPVVVPYYHRTHNYRICSRTGMDCSYLTRNFRFVSVPGASGRKKHVMSEDADEIDIYETHGVYESDLRLPKKGGYEVRPRLDRARRSRREPRASAAIAGLPERRSAAPERDGRARLATAREPAGRAARARTDHVRERTGQVRAAASGERRVPQRADTDCGKREREHGGAAGAAVCGVFRARGAHGRARQHRYEFLRPAAPLLRRVPVHKVPHRPRGRARCHVQARGRRARGGAAVRGARSRSVCSEGRERRAVGVLLGDDRAHGREGLADAPLGGRPVATVHALELGCDVERASVRGVVVAVDVCVERASHGVVHGALHRDHRGGHRAHV